MASIGQLRGGQRGFIVSPGGEVIADLIGQAEEDLSASYSFNLALIYGIPGLDTTGGLRVSEASRIFFAAKEDWPVFWALAEDWGTRYVGEVIPLGDATKLRVWNRVTHSVTRRVYSGKAPYEREFELGRGTVEECLSERRFLTEFQTGDWYLAS